MAKFEILKACADKYTRKNYKPGDVLEVDEKRAAELRNSKACREIVDAEPKQEATEPAPEEQPEPAPVKRGRKKKAAK